MVSVPSPLYGLFMAPNATNGSVIPPFWGFGGEWIYFPSDATGSAHEIQFLGGKDKVTGSTDLTMWINFNGSGIAVVGDSPCTPACALESTCAPLCTLKYNLDGADGQSTISRDGTSTLYNVSRAVGEDHNLTFSVPFEWGWSINYVSITPTSATVLDAFDKVYAAWYDPSMVYSGNWIESGGEYQALGEGATVEFQFSGTTVGVIGTFDIDLKGTVSLNISLDGGEPIVSNTSVVDYADGRGLALYYQSQVLDRAKPDNDAHTIKVEVEATGEQVFSLLGLSYTPSFNSLAEMPDLSLPITSSSPGPKPPRVNKGAVAGGAAGGVLFLLLVIVSVFLVLRQRHQSVGEDEQIHIAMQPYPFMETVAAKPPLGKGTPSHFRYTTGDSEAREAVSVHSRQPSLSACLDNESVPGERGHDLSEEVVRTREMIQSLQARVDAIDVPPEYRSDAGERELG